MQKRQFLRKCLKHTNVFERVNIIFKTKGIILKEYENEHRYGLVRLVFHILIYETYFNSHRILNTAEKT